MSTNIEIKARAQDLQAQKNLAASLSDTPVQVIPQEDTFFHTPRGRLKLRLLAPDCSQLVYYERTDQEGPKRSDYFIFETSDAEGLKSVLTKSLGIRGVVRKVRHLYMVGQTRVHLDEVEGLGQFLELEVVLRPQQTEAEGREIAADLMRELGIADADLLEGAYMDMLESRHGPTIRRINHVAVVVDDIPKTLEFWRDALGLTMSGLHEVAAEKSQVAFLPLGVGEIELIKPTTGDSGIARYLARRGPGLHHICLEVDDIGGALARLKAQGVRLINAEPQQGTDGRKYVFVHPESTGGVLVELYQL